MFISIVLLISLFAVHSYGFIAFPRQLMRNSISLNAKASISAGDKIRVRLLQNVEGQGRQGETVMVSQSLWLNVLQPKKIAVKITEQQLAQEAAQLAEAAEKEISEATALGNHLKHLEMLEIPRKMGSSGQLFGSITRKFLLELLHSKADSNAWKSKHIAIVEIKTCTADGTSCDVNLTDHEIKHAGIYDIELKLHPKVDHVHVKLHVMRE
eukprot:gene12433-26158_t